MIKIKKFGFTLSEVLIALTILGVIAALALPGLIKNVNDKSMYSLLQGTMNNMADAVQQELINSSATNIKDTRMWNNPRAFLRDSFDVKLECNNGYDTPCHAKQYYNFNGGKVGAGTGAPALLKNGVAVDLMTTSAGDIIISVDVNGRKDPNIVGVDYFYAGISGKTDLDKGLRMGAVGGILQDGIDDDPLTISNARLKQLCVQGWGTPCYYLLERSGFDPNYLRRSY